MVSGNGVGRPAPDEAAPDLDLAALLFPGKSAGGRPLPGCIVVNHCHQRQRATMDLPGLLAVSRPARELAQHR